jgi:hypothetical protein
MRTIDNLLSKSDMKKLEGDQDFYPEESATLLASVVGTKLDNCRGTVIFKLGCNWGLLSRSKQIGSARERRMDEIMALDAARHITALAPGIFRVLSMDYDELLVVAHGLVDGAAVLGAASRLLQCYDTVLRDADSSWLPDVAIGIALPQKSGGTAVSLLAAANNALREAMQAVCPDVKTNYSLSGRSVRN